MIVVSSFYMNEVGTGEKSSAGTNVVSKDPNRISRAEMPLTTNQKEQRAWWARPRVAAAWARTGEGAQAPMIDMREKAAVKML